MYFLRGSLPWQNLKGNNKKDKYERIMEKKISTQVDVLCKGFPIEFTQYMTYCRNLKFDEQPDYNYCRQLFADLMVKLNYKTDNIYDWNIMAQEKKKEVPSL